MESRHEKKRLAMARKRNTLDQASMKSGLETIKEAAPNMKERREKVLHEKMMATRRQNNIAEWSNCINTTSFASNTSGRANLEFITKLRTKKVSPKRSDLSLDYQEIKDVRAHQDHTPKVYYKKYKARDNIKDYDYKGNFQDIQHLMQREVLG